MDNSLFADFAGSLERVKINGEERSFADCDGVILRPKNSNKPEFYWLSVTDQNRLRLSYPGPGPTETISLRTLIDLFMARCCTVGVVDTNGQIRTPDRNPATRSSHNHRYEIRITGPLNTELVYGRDDQSSVLRDTTNYLIREHDLIQAVSPLPWVPGRNKAVINDTPTYPDSNEQMQQFEELEGNYYLDTQYKMSDKKRRLRQMCDAVSSDLKVSFAGDW